MMSLSWPLSVHYLPESTTSHTRLNEAHREQPRHITADHDNQTTSQFYLYEYEGLTSTDELRILELSKGNPKDPLHGTLTKCRLQNFAAYEALSYTWENYDSDEPLDTTPGRDMIYLGPFWDAFVVTRNCYKALRRLRYTDRTRILWVDSICIDQENESERSHQVWLMQRIYENALSVVLYLGYEDADSSIALQVLRNPERLLNLNNVELGSLKALFKRPYFSRLWIVQEVALAKSLYFYRGSSETFIPLFSRGTLESLLTVKETAPTWIKYSSLRQSTEPRSLWSLLQDTNSCHCSDPRDKVFGILSLVTANSKKELKPDYSLSVEEVYTGIGALLIREKGLLCVLELAARTPISSSLPSWAPNWAACSINSRRWAPDEGYRHRYPYETEMLYKEKIFEVPIYSPPVYMGSADSLSSQVSVTGALTVKGILLSAHASNFEHVKRDLILSRNYNRTLSISLYITKTAYPLADPGRAESFDLHNWRAFAERFHSHEPTNNFIPNHMCVLLPAPNYSQALILKPIDGKEEFTFLGIGEIGASISAARDIPPPELLCLLPISKEERAFARNGVISRPNEFPLLRGSNVIWSRSKNNPEDYWNQRLVKILQDLFSNNFLTFHEEEARLWARWQKIEGECMSMFLDPAKIEYIADYMRSLKGSTDWKTFQEDPEMPHSDIMGLEFSNFLSLFILDPSKRCATARDMTLKYDHSKDDISQNDNPKHTLNRLLDWQICTLDLLNHMHDMAHGRVMPFIRILPGEDLLRTANRTWGYYSSIAAVVCHKEPSWYGWITWFMTKMIARQYLETTDLGGEDPRGGSLKRVYWDWDHMKTTMDKRVAIWSQLIEFRRRFENECGNCDLDLLAHKIGTRRLMKEVGYDLDDEAVRNRSVTIR
jgi:hypothetical protein